MRVLSLIQIHFVNLVLMAIKAYLLIDFRNYVGVSHMTGPVDLWRILLIFKRFFFMAH